MPEPEDSRKSLLFKKKKEEQVKEKVKFMINAEVKPKGSSQAQVPPETVLFTPHTPGG